MTTSNTPDQRIDGILEKLYQKVFNHAYELGQEFPDDKNPDMVFDPCNEEDITEAKAALKSLFETMCLEVVGDNQHSEHKEWDCPCGATHSFTEEWHATNRLRDEQRKKLASIFGKEMHNDN